MGQPKAKDIANNKSGTVFFRTLCSNAFMRLGSREIFHWYRYTGGLGTGRVYDYWQDVGHEYGTGNVYRPRVGLGLVNTHVAAE